MGPAWTRSWWVRTVGRLSRPFRRGRLAHRPPGIGEAWARRLFESNIIGILFSDASARLTGANDAFLQMIGCTREDLESGKLNWMEMTPREWQEADHKAIAELLSTGVCTPYEKEYLRSDGRRLPVLIGAAVLPETREAVGFVLDLTDRKRAEQQAEAASRAKDHFLAALSHELRTPLTPVLLKIAMLREQPDLPAGLRADLRMIQRNIELEAKLIDDLLDLTRITRGKLSLHCEVTDVHLLLDHVVSICADEVAGKRLHVDLTLEARERSVWADEARLQQVFWNLLKNAVKFTPAGGRIEIRTANEVPGRVRIDVIDRGIGIEPETLPRLFNAFEQGDATITRTFGGLGLGLAICKALVDQHGGTLTGVSAGRGKGATFTVVLETVSTPMRGERSVAAAATPAGRPLRLLLVEDHEPTLEVMTDLLEAAGHQVKAARDLASARRLAAEGELDLLVSDLGLPDGSGLDLMREVRELYGLPGIAVSGYGLEEDLRRSREAGFAEHLIKPIDPAKLKAAIARAAGG
ncbi:MAG TPA: ATP-binding protein [Thermoanaerobaculia bacterium]|nr:ATP-binding protein [Thermoanaerobaculia bacterium]